MVERGGVLLGFLEQKSDSQIKPASTYKLRIERSIEIDNQSQKNKEFVLAGTYLQKYINRRDFVGLFHTHRYWPLPGFKDIQAMHKLVKHLDKPLVLGIQKKKTTYWLFEVGTYLPRTIKSVTDE